MPASEYWGQPYPIGDGDELRSYVDLDHYQHLATNGRQPFGPAVTFQEDDNSSQISGMTFEYEHPDCLILCVSLSNTERVYRHMPADKDRCVEIASAAELANLMFEQGKIGDDPVRRWFTRLDHGKVMYRRKAFTGPVPADFVNDPFVKETRYAHQEELRFCLVPATQLPLRTLLVDCPAITPLLTTVDLPR